MVEIDTLLCFMLEQNVVNDFNTNGSVVPFYFVMDGTESMTQTNDADQEF